MHQFDLKNRTSIITGGAQGFGLAITERFIQSGAKVIIWDIDKEATETTIKKISSENCIYQIVDVKNFGAGDLLEIQNTEKKIFHIPMNNENLSKVEIEKKIITVDPLKGLLD